ncbi:MAG TPA: hypothetical protein VL262_17430 [Vicinamibacterales bacterium]|jgi:hypothetical protein|nr:hypothetical protein [Vicinamibacterales bacterium]
MKAATRSTTAVCGLLVLLLAGCEAKKSSNPLSPSVAGPIPGVDITAPSVLQPSQGFKFRDNQQPITLMVNNAATSGVRPLSYAFDVAADSSFNTKLFSRAGVAPGADGKTSVQLDLLEIGRTYYWRVRAEDGANTGPYTTSSFDIQPKPAVSAPGLISPINNAQISGTTATLLVSNATWVGPVGGLSYEFQVARDQGFGSLASAGIVLEGHGQTTFVTAALAGPATYFWRARASDGPTTSAWSGTQTFRTAAAAPSPSPSPAPAPGGPCNASDPLTIVTCERNKYGHMSTGDIVNFLFASAQSLTRNGIAGAPFGVLRKSGGSNCNGYSCDIICSGQGNSQKQWDVLGDSDGAQTPNWNGPATVPNIRVDTCDIR